MMPRTVVLPLALMYVTRTGKAAGIWITNVRERGESFDTSHATHRPVATGRGSDTSSAGHGGDSKALTVETVLERGSHCCGNQTHRRKTSKSAHANPSHHSPRQAPSVSLHLRLHCGEVESRSIDIGEKINVPSFHIASSFGAIAVIELGKFLGTLDVVSAEGALSHEPVCGWDSPSLASSFDGTSVSGFAANSAVQLGVNS